MASLRVKMGDMGEVKGVPSAHFGVEVGGYFADFQSNARVAESKNENSGKIS